MTTKVQFLSQVERLRKSIIASMDIANIGWESDERKINQRKKKVFDKKNGFSYFVNNYFPHYVRHKSKSELHKYLFKELPKILQDKHSTKHAISAPRGEAKSTICSQLFILYCIITEQTHYSLIVMDSIDQAYPMLEAIKIELESNPRLIMDFPKVVGIGRVWQSGTIVTKNNIKVQVAGAGKKLRGLRHGARRPDKVILDDIENDENVRKPEQRDKLHNWLRKTIEPLGSAGEKLDIIYIGTILHYDSVLNRTLNEAGWQSARFKAIVQMPDRMDLWDEWEALYCSKQTIEAEQFYRQNKQAMEQGAKVSWKARPLYILMKIRATSHEAFDSEYQNDPSSGSDAPFNNSIHFWHSLPNNLMYFGAIDPSLGKKGASRDPSAIIIGGYHKATGILYIIVADIKKRLPDKIISDIIRYQAQYNCLIWAVESVQFQEFFRTELVKRGAEMGVHIPAQPVIPHNDKLLRIESLQPHMFNKVILLHKEQATLIDQFRHFPKADHDDGCDGVEMLWKLVTSFNQATKREVIDMVEPSVY